MKKCLSSLQEGRFGGSSPAFAGDFRGSRETVTPEQMTYSNMLAVNALVELLDERGIIPKRDVLERIKALQASVQSSRKTQ